MLRVKLRYGKLLDDIGIRESKEAADALRAGYDEHSDKYIDLRDVASQATRAILGSHPGLERGLVSLIFFAGRRTESVTGKVNRSIFAAV